MQHHRTYDHHGLEDCSTVLLSEAVGRYAAGTSLCEVIDDLHQRIAFLQETFSVATIDAWVVPAGSETAKGFLVLSSLIRALSTSTTSIDAEVVAPTPVTRSDALGVSAYLLAPSSPVTQLDESIDATQTTITVDNYSSFSSSGDFLIQINDEIMLVTGGQGTDTWTVIRGYGGTTATSHGAGSIVVAC